MTWPTVSPRVREFIRQGAELALQSPELVSRAVDEATLGSRATASIAADPGLSEAMRRANYDNLLAWATANLREPGEPVPANASAVQLDVARDLVRRGLDKAALDGYRTGQSAAL